MPTTPPRSTHDDRLMAGVALVLLVLMLIVGVAWYGMQQRRERVERAIAEIRQIEVVLKAMCTDAGVEWFADMVDPPRDPEAPLAERMAEDTVLCTALLRSGRMAVLATGNGEPFARGMAAGVQAKLGTSYLDLTVDPWGHPYAILIGEASGETFGRASGAVVRPATTVGPGLVSYAPGGKFEAPEMESAPAGWSVYVVSLGPNGVLDQGPDADPVHGDDLGSWATYW